MPKVSIIVPVYNTEKYLSQCIESILAQTFDDFELILVNDGSTDNSGKICDVYAKLDNRIRAIHTSNKGVNAARQLGVNLSRGFWINFIDSDDTINNNALELLYNETTNNVDIIIGQIENHKYPSGTYSIDEYRRALLLGKFPPSYAKLYRREIFDYYIFNIPRDITIAEDLLMNIRLSFNAKKEVTIIPNIIYYYRIRQDSVFHTYTPTYQYYENLFEHYLKSIPFDYQNKYGSEIFKFAYDKWSNFCGYRILIPNKWKKFEIYKYVKYYSKANRLIIKHFDWNLINSDNLIVRSLLIISKKIRNRLHTK